MGVEVWIFSATNLKEIHQLVPLLTLLFFAGHSRYRIEKFEWVWTRAWSRTKCMQSPSLMGSCCYIHTRTEQAMQAYYLRSCILTKRKTMHRYIVAGWAWLGSLTAAHTQHCMCSFLFTIFFKCTPLVSQWIYRKAWIEDRRMDIVRKFS